MKLSGMNHLLNLNNNSMEKENIKPNEELIPKKETKVPEKESDMVMIKKDVLETLMDKVQNLEDKLIAPAPSQIKKKNRQVKVRMIDGKIVIGYGKCWEERATDGRKYLVIEVVTEDGEKHQVEYVKFNEQGEYLVGEVIDTKIDPSRSEEKITGYVNATVHDYANFRSHKTEKEVPLMVVKQNYIFKIKLPDGREIELPDNSIN
jgi:RNase P/RNase MRP subunit p29